MKKIDWYLVRSIAIMAILFFGGLWMIVKSASALLTCDLTFWKTVLYIFGAVIGLYLSSCTLYVAFQILKIEKMYSDEEDYN